MKSENTNKKNFPAIEKFLKETKETIRELEIEVGYDLFKKFMWGDTMKTIHIVTYDNEIVAVFDSEKEAFDYSDAKEKKYPGTDFYVDEFTVNPDWSDD